MNTDTCPKGKSHNYIPLVPFDSPAGTEPTSVHCKNCGKTIDYTADEDEVPFPSITENKD